MKTLPCVGLLALTSVALAQPDTTKWISHYNGVDGWFEFQGPQRAMVLNPADFGLQSPVQVESLKIWFYWGMGSFTDSVFTFRIYSGNGSTLLWESESLMCPRTYWVYYGLSAPVRIDTGRFYIVTTARRVDPYAHPYINCDDATPQWSFYGQPGNWTVCTVGNYCFFAFVREVQTGIEEPRWLGPKPKLPWSSIVANRVPVPAGVVAPLVTSDGRTACHLTPGENDLTGLAPGVYFADLGTQRLKLTLPE